MGVGSSGNREGTAKLQLQAKKTQKCRVMCDKPTSERGRANRVYMVHEVQTPIKRENNKDIVNPGDAGSDNHLESMSSLSVAVHPVVWASSE